MRESKIIPKEGTRKVIQEAEIDESERTRETDRDRTDSESGRIDGKDYPHSNTTLII